MSDLLDPNDVRVALAATLSGIAGIGKVHKYRRIVRNDADVATQYMQGGKINVWMIGFALNNAAINDKKMGYHAIGVPGGGLVMTTFGFSIEAYYGVDDANDSEEAFANLAWLVVKTLNSYGKLTDPMVNQGPCQLAQTTYAMLANKYLTHFARLSIAIEGRTQ